jgi:membrane protein
VLRHPAAFALRALQQLQPQSGLLLAAAIAYYALLSVVPLLILSVIALSHLVAEAELLATIGRYLEWLVPSQSHAFLAEISKFMEQRAAVGAVLLLTMLFFSSLAFSVLEKAMAVIFAHRNAGGQRHFLTSACCPTASSCCWASHCSASPSSRSPSRRSPAPSLHFLGLGVVAARAGRICSTSSASAPRSAS